MKIKRVKFHNATLRSRLDLLILVCLVPLAILVIYLLVELHQFSGRYDLIVENITKANDYNIDFKDELDYSVYNIIVNSERASDLEDSEKPNVMISEANEVFQKLYDDAERDSAKKILKRILKCLSTLEDRVEEIEKDAQVSGNYDLNMERLDLNIRVLTDLIQEQIQRYIYYETTNLDSLKEGIRSDVNFAIRMSVLVFGVILLGTLLINRRIMAGITRPIDKLRKLTKEAGHGNFAVHVEENGTEEMVELAKGFNHMQDKLDQLVGDIKVEQLNLRATELKLLQAQINPHFLYNTLDTIVWLAESGEKEQVVKMVTALSDFFRTTLSKGQDFITVKEEKSHIDSYLKIQKFRYRDIMDYEINIPEELYDYSILKMTLQPLVENALYHGIKNKRGMGHILVNGVREDDKLVFTVEDNGRGMNDEELTYVRSLIRGEAPSEGRSSGFGLYNVYQRLKLNYGPDYGLEINSLFGEWTKIRVVIPAVKK